LTKQTDYVSLFSQKYKRKQEEEPVKDKIQEVLNNIRPSLNADGGDVELVDVKEGIVSLRLTGACAGCPFSSMTLKNSIEKILKQEISDIKEVVAV
jgi:Fe-S cluster biogenesis protein NfuA